MVSRPMPTVAGTVLGSAVFSEVCARPLRSRIAAPGTEGVAAAGRGRADRAPGALADGLHVVGLGDDARADGADEGDQREERHDPRAASEQAAGDQGERDDPQGDGPRDGRRAHRVVPVAGDQHRHAGADQRQTADQRGEPAERGPPGSGAAPRRGRAPDVRRDGGRCRERRRPAVRRVGRGRRRAGLARGGRARGSGRGRRRAGWRGGGLGRGGRGLQRAGAQAGSPGRLGSRGRPDSRPGTGRAGPGVPEPRPRTTR